MPIDPAELRRLDEAATKGPWTAGRPDMGTVVDGFVSKWIYDEKDQYVAVASGRIEGEWEEVMANAQLIAYLRNHVAEIVAALEENERLKANMADKERWGYAAE